jgi:hypothetical protein
MAKYGKAAAKSVKRALEREKRGACSRNQLDNPACSQHPRRQLVFPDTGQGILPIDQILNTQRRGPYGNLRH